jgi:hypothetical protein
VAPSPSITDLAQPVASASSQDLTVNTSSNTLPSFSSININPADTLLNPLDHNIGNITDAEFQALLHMALLSGALFMAVMRWTQFKITVKRNVWMARKWGNKLVVYSTNYEGFYTLKNNEYYMNK